jgi:hypothetical protein
VPPGFIDTHDHISMGIDCTIQGLWNAIGRILDPPACAN